MNNKPGWQDGGFFTQETDVVVAMDRLVLHIQQMESRFTKFSPKEILDKPAVNKWSKQEILGHLVDSALNNLKRFTEIQFLPQPYQVVSYRQDELVNVNHYQDLPVEHLLALWTALNQQILFVVKNIPQEKLDYRVDPQYDNKEMKTLGWIICDYVAHLGHHLKQL
jgi:hypothetical protein